MSIESLSDKARTFYVTQEEIDATHPMNDGVTCYAEDEAAMILVGERHGKRELVDLVRTLLIRAHLSQPQPESTCDDERPCLPCYTNDGECTGPAVQPQPVALGEIVTFIMDGVTVQIHGDRESLDRVMGRIDKTSDRLGNYATPTIPTGHRVVPEVATFATERAALVAKIGDCCMGGDPLCAAGCLVEKAAKKNAERGAYSAASTRLSVVPDAKVSEPDDHPDAGLYIKGWNDCRDALLAASPSAGGV